MAFYGEKFIHANIHDFKSNISRYIHMIETGRFDGVIVKRYNSVVGLFVPMKRERPLSKDVRIELEGVAEEDQSGSLPFSMTYLMGKLQ